MSAKKGKNFKKRQILVEKATKCGSISLLFYFYLENKKLNGQGTKCGPISLLLIVSLLDHEPNSLSN